MGPLDRPVHLHQKSANRNADEAREPRQLHASHRPLPGFKPASLSEPLTPRGPARACRHRQLCDMTQGVPGPDRARAPRRGRHHDDARKRSDGGRTPDPHLRRDRGLTPTHICAGTERSTLRARWRGIGLSAISPPGGLLCGPTVAVLPCARPERTAVRPELRGERRATVPSQ